VRRTTLYPRTAGDRRANVTGTFDAVSVL